MIPQTFPSNAAGSDGGAVMQAKFLTSVTGLVRWTDYIPVKLKTGGVQDSTDNNGFISIEQAVLTASSKAFVDYYPVYVDNAATKAWECSADGYIPYAPHNTAGCSLVLDFTNGASLDSRITFTRTTDASNPATYVNSSGYVTAATNNEPRFDYDPVTLACKGLLIEESRINSCLYSSEFDNANWLKTEISVSQDVITSPDGTVNADKLIYSANNSVHNIRKTGLTSAAYSASVYAKAGEETVFSIWLRSAAVFAVFDLSTGTITSKSASVTASITDSGNGWYRCVAYDPTAGTTLHIYGRNGGAFSGNGVDGLYLWGAQLEAGAFATSYIPTTTTALTRNADVATMTGTNFSDWFNASEGTVYSETTILGFRSNQTSFCLDDGVGASSSKNISIRHSGSSSPVARAVIVDTTTQLDKTVATASTIRKLALGYASNNSIFAADSVLSTAVTSMTIPSGLVQAQLGTAFFANSYLNGHLRKVSYYPQRLTNAELQAISK